MAERPFFRKVFQMNLQQIKNELAKGNRVFWSNKNYEEDYPNCHPANVGRPQLTFIARFKYGRKPYRRWINFICKNFTCEEWVTELKETHAPLRMMQARGFKG